MNRPVNKLLQKFGAMWYNWKIRHIAVRGELVSFNDGPVEPKTLRIVREYNGPYDWDQEGSA